MLGRRDFLKHSLAVAAVTQAGTLAADAAAQDMPMPNKSHSADNIRFVIFDEYFEDSVAFADVLVAQGAQAFSVQQDLGRLWFGELGGAFSPGASIAGLTSHSELLICSSFARQRGARVRYEGEHDCRGGDILTHSLRGNESMCAVGSTLAVADAQWPRVLATNLVNATANDDSLRREQFLTTTRRSQTHPGSLFSWVIA